MCIRYCANETSVISRYKALATFAVAFVDQPSGNVCPCVEKGDGKYVSVKLGLSHGPHSQQVELEQYCLKVLKDFFCSTASRHHRFTHWHLTNKLSQALNRASFGSVPEMVCTAGTIGGSSCKKNLYAKRMSLCMRFSMCAIAPPSNML